MIKTFVNLFNTEHNIMIVTAIIIVQLFSKQVTYIVQKDRTIRIVMDSVSLSAKG